MNTLQLQQALKAAGFDPGPLDGVWGRRTRAAVRAFQRAARLLVDGVPGPRTIGALLQRVPGPPVTIAGGAAIAAPWLAEARRKMGLHEARDRKGLMAWLRSDGATLGDPSKLPWCGDFVETAIALTLPDEIMVANPYLARNWLKFGVPLERPAPGAIAVFWRGARNGSSGHVGFYVGERGDGALKILGGNQSNAVTEAWLDRDRLLGWRWPATWPPPTTGPVVVTGSGALSTNEA